jgi:hypothetical protein
MNELLIDAIKLLAASAHEQRAYLKKSGLFPCTDEIALQFDDAYRYFETRESHLTGSISNKLKSINAMLDVLSNSADKSIWNEKSLAENSWTDLRKITSSILEEINKPPTQ